MRGPIIGGVRHRRHSELWVMRYRAALIAAGLGLLGYVLATWVLIHRGQFVTGIGSGFSSRFGCGRPTPEDGCGAAQLTQLPTPAM